MMEKTAPEKPEASEKLEALRAQMRARGVDGYLVPREDEFQGEYVPACAERLAWLTGFTGSAGIAAVLENRAFVCTDGRYIIQIRRQTDSALFETGISDGAAAGALAPWIAANAPAGARIGYDPMLHTPAGIAAMEKILKEKNIALVPLEGNLVDAVWTDRPPAPSGMAEAFPDEIAGRTAAEKRAAVAETVRRDGGGAAVLTMPDSIAWLLNIRGSDVPHIPLALSYAVIHANGDKGGDVDWYIDPAKIPPALARHLGDRVRVRPPAGLAAGLAQTAAAAKKADLPVRLDCGGAPVWFRTTLERAGARVDDRPDPCILPRACKTPQEQAAIAAAHVRDGAAMARFLAWLDSEAPKGTLTEIGAEEKLLEFRRMDPRFRDTSFNTIAGWAGNGAIVHYRATPETDALITPPGVFLVDSGAQYADGTTDITRTVAVGAPPEEAKENFTRVLKGHIAIAALRFPEGVTGQQIDVLARRALWEAGLDYLHGTGHGVGCYLSVHESGVAISVRAAGKFLPGMLVSNEPGFYKENAYGIRIENLVLVKEDGKSETSGRTMLRFEDVTLAPIDLRMVKPEMLDEAERRWLDDYHERVFRTLSPLVEDSVKTWLRQATAPLKKNLSPAAPAPRPAPRL